MMTVLFTLADVVFVARCVTSCSSYSSSRSRTATISSISSSNVSACVAVTLLYWLQCR